jgi:hypothetical protein
MTDFAPPASQTPRVLRSILRQPLESYRLQKTLLHGTGAPSRAPPSVRTLTPDARNKQTQVPSSLVVCRQHTPTTSSPQSTHIHDIRNTNIDTRLPTTMTQPFNLPDSYKQVLLKRPPDAPLRGRPHRSQKPPSGSPTSTLPIGPTARDCRTRPGHAPGTHTGHMA